MIHIHILVRAGTCSLHNSKREPSDVGSTCYYLNLAVFAEVSTGPFPRHNPLLTEWLYYNYKKSLNKLKHILDTIEEHTDSAIFFLLNARSHIVWLNAASLSRLYSIDCICLPFRDR